MRQAKYKVNHSYSAQIDEQRVSLNAGEEVWLPESLAERVNADSPGALTLLAHPTPRTNRMLTGGNVNTRGVLPIVEEGSAPDDQPPASPAARVLAESLKIDLRDIPYAGDQITVSDVQTAAGKKETGSAQPDAVFGATKSGKAFKGNADSVPGKKKTN